MVESPYRSVNPATGELLQVFDLHGDDVAFDALARADAMFRDHWSKISFADRAGPIARAAALMRERRDELARLAALEMGKKFAEGLDEVELSASILDYYAQNAARLLAPAKIESGRFEAWTENSPLGVLIGIQPWNYPYYQLARFVAPNLMSGNTILLKHAPGVPQCALIFADILREAGLPEGVYANLFLTNDQVASLIDDPRIKGVALTGSERAGEALAAQAGRNLKKNTMELGGSDAFIVLEDADLDAVMPLAVGGRVGNCGQTCIGAKRFIVVGDRYERFVESLAHAFTGLKLGDPLDPETNVGPLSSSAAMDLLLRQVGDATAHGATLVCGGIRGGSVGAFVEPGILTDVTPDNPAYRSEFFGPVAMVFRAEDDAEAVAIANDTPFGLGGSVYSTDIEHAKRIASQVRTGMMFINYPSISAPELPFGGIDRSGYGKELSADGIREFINRKLVCVAPSGDFSSVG